MPRRLLHVAALLASLALLPFHCRKSEGAAVDPLDREAEEHLVRYLQIDTSNPPGNETSGAKFLQALLVKEGIEATLVGSKPDRQSVYARLKSGSTEPALLLLHHIDVVPVAQAEWTKPAFAGLRAGGYIWGRGALDVKSLGIAQLMALVELRRRNIPLRRDIIYLGVADEELGGTHGCKELLETRPELFANLGYVLNEGGSNETIVDRVTFWGVEVQQKAPLWLRLHAKGTPGHAAAPPEGGGSVARLVRALAAVQEIETPYRLTPAVAEYFHAVGKTRNDDRGALLRSIAEPLDVARIERVLPQGYRSLLRDTIAITRVDGGTSVNSIPARASADIDIRLLPDTTPAKMIEQVRAAVGSNGEIEVLLEAAPSPASRADTELFRVLERTMKEDQPGSRVASVVSAGTTDSRFFRARGITAYGIAPFKVNYYDAGTVHANDERIRARFFVEGVRLTRRIVHQFCAR